ncbi:acetylglutamate kinase [Gammaproteobacteria bacterium]|nr:acetylglutamate kinase [Gammaproteobacteria bacterium]
MEKNKAEQVIKILTEALPFIQKFSKKICIVKYGGAAMVEKDLKYSFARDIALMKQVGINVIVVHGGGPQIDEQLSKVKIKRNFVDGIRITDNKTIEVVSKTLSNIVNKEIVELINSNGANAIGISNNESKYIQVKKYISDKADYGYVGEITNIDTNYFCKLLDSNYIPVIAPLGFDENNNIYNINADSAASKIASELAAEKIIFLTDQQGVLNKKKELISSLNFEEINKLIKNEVITGGMLPKIQACLDAINNNVKMAHIVDGRIQHSVLLEIFTNEGIGTLVKK